MNESYYRKISTAVMSLILAAGLAACGANAGQAESTAASSVAVNDGSAAASGNTETSAKGKNTAAVSQTSSGTAGKSGTKNMEVHLGDQPSFFILKIADDLGYFKDEFSDKGVSIVVDDFVNQGSAVIEAMSAGNVQLGAVGSLPFIAAVANGNDFKAVATINCSKDGFVLFANKDSGVKTVKDFKGKSIAVKFSSNEHQMVLTLLDQAGLKTGDVAVTNMSASDGLTALLKGEVTGALLKGDQLKAANDAGEIPVANNSQTGIISNMLMIRNDFGKEHPDIVEGVIRVLKKTQKWIEEHPDETVARYVKITNVDEGTAKASFDSRYRSVDVKQEEFTEPLQRSLDFSRQQKLIDSKNLTVNDLIDTSYIKAVGE